DAPTRETLIADLAHVLRERGVTTVMVTHDRDEALSLADRIGVVIDGELRQLDTAEAVFGMPTDPEIAAFVGVENVIPARVERATRQSAREMGLAEGARVVASFKATVPHLLPRIRH